ncbi:pentapeptide repeat-containing protein [Neorhodopirellula pilleata]|uniref:pentapeptide repeat-containing protein n=1 Tax=Neorhodopirellula pilleata TaxID=2714738 RepID=UPI0011B3F98D
MSCLAFRRPTDGPSSLIATDNPPTTSPENPCRYTETRSTKHKALPDRIAGRCSAGPKTNQQSRDRDLILQHTGLPNSGLLNVGLLNVGLLNSGLLNSGLLNSGLLNVGLRSAAAPKCDRCPQAFHTSPPGSGSSPRMPRRPTTRPRRSKSLREIDPAKICPPHLPRGLPSSRPAGIATASTTRCLKVARGFLWFSLDTLRWT